MPPLRPAGKTFTPSTSGDTDDGNDDEEGDDGSANSSSAASSGSIARGKLPKHLQTTGLGRRMWEDFKGGMNFYRLHLIVFTFAPLIIACIFYGANGQIHIPFIDCLFICVSAMTVTGLATVNLSTLTGFQQGTLFALMLIGSPVSVSLITITVRRHFFQVKFKNIVANERERQRRQRKLSFGPWSTTGESTAGTTGGGGASRMRRPSFLSVAGARERFRAGSSASQSQVPTDQQQSQEPVRSPVTSADSSSTTATEEDDRAGWADKLARSSRGADLWRSLRSTIGLGRTFSGDGTPTTDSADREQFKSAKKARKEAEKHERGRRERLEKEFGKGRIGGFGGHASSGATGGTNGGYRQEKRGDSVGPPSGLRTSMIRRVEGEVPMLVNMAGQRGGIAVDRVPTPRTEEDDRPPPFPISASAEATAEVEDGNGLERVLSHQGERVSTPEELESPPEMPSSEPAPPIAAAPTPPTQTSITIVPTEVPRRGSAQTDSALSTSGHTTTSVPGITTQAAGAEAFPRSKTIAFDPDQVATHDHVAGAAHAHPHAHASHAASAPNAPPPTATASGHGFPRTGTIEFRGAAVGGPGGEGLGEGLGRRHPSTAGGTAFERTNTRRSEMTGTMRGAGSSAGFPRTATLRTTGGRSVKRTKDSGFGGFPMPHELARSAIHYFFPSFERRVTRNFTLQRTGTFQRPGGLPVNRTATMASGRSYTGTINPAGAGGPVPVPYISFDAVVGRNSRFRDLTSEQMEELGGVEYRALKVLLWIVPCYVLIMQLSGWIIFYPYISAKGRYDNVFESQPRFVPIGWYTAFQAVSAFSNTGMSLCDESMLPFQTAYLMIYYMILLILAGNTAFPIFLRFVIWTLSKLCSSTSRLHETCRFLLDHPRRCYLYLFPAHQTLFLLAVIFFMSMVDWVSFLVLDIGTPTIESLPIGTRISAGFLQTAAVRAAGFSIVPLNSLAPAVKVLYALMMYVSVYPIAMSVRATNVYEERSLGMFEEEEEEEDDGEDEYQENVKDGKVAGWTRYLAFHARRQLAFDMWWLGLALWLICIIERAQINNAASDSYFNIFSIIFELISGYGTVGLSLGVANDNYSLSGGFKTLSKLVVIAVMIRGRHRGLPVAIDRAVMLPKELLEVDADVEEEVRARNSRRSSLPSEPGRSNSRTRRDSSFSFTATNPVRGGRPGQPWFPSADNAAGAGESALSDDDDPPLPPQTQRAGLATGRHPVGAPLAPVKELPSAAISRNPSHEDLSSPHA